MHLFNENKFRQHLPYIGTYLELKKKKKIQTTKYNKPNHHSQTKYVLTRTRFKCCELLKTMILKQLQYK